MFDALLSICNVLTSLVKSLKEHDIKIDVINVDFDSYWKSRMNSITYDEIYADCREKS